MKFILTAAFIDIVLLLAFRLSGPKGIPLMQLLAAANIFFYAARLLFFLRKTEKLPERFGFLLEFVCLQFFLCAGVFLFKLTDLMILLNCR